MKLAKCVSQNASNGLVACVYRLSKGIQHPELPVVRERSLLIAVQVVPHEAPGDCISTIDRKIERVESVSEGGYIFWEAEFPDELLGTCSKRGDGRLDKTMLWQVSKLPASCV